MIFRKNIPPVGKLYATISKNNLQKSSIKTDELWYSRVFGRKVSIYFTWLLLKLGLTPNQSTFLSFVLGTLGLCFFASSNITYIIFGFTLFHLYIIIDSSDGEMARYLDMKSDMGAFYDKLLHYLMKIGIIIVISLQIFNSTADIRVIIFGLVVALLSGFTSTFYHLLPRNTKVSYADQVKQDGVLVSYLRKFFRLITGDIELSIVLFLLLISEPLFKIQVSQILFLLLVSQFLLLLSYIIEQLYTSISKA